MNSIEAMIARKSIRQYEQIELTNEQKEQILATAEQAFALTDSKMKLYVLGKNQAQEGMSGIIGDYGKLISAQCFLAMTATECPNYLLDSGFRFEQVILEATKLGLGTCWVGGFVKESALQTILDIPKEERIIALTPIGQPSKPSITSILARKAMGSSKRLPLNAIFSWKEAGKPLPQLIMGNPNIVRLLEAIRLAPSWANKQPAKYILSESGLEIYKTSEQLKDGKDYHLVDCGISMAHAHLAAQEIGFAGKWTFESEYIAKYLFNNKPPWIA